VRRASDFEKAKSLLREVFLAFKAIHDAGEGDDSPIGAPLWNGHAPRR
jgi:hypothetical protein